MTKKHLFAFITITVYTALSYLCISSIIAGNFTFAIAVGTLWLAVICIIWMAASAGWHISLEKIKPVSKISKLFYVIFSYYKDVLAIINFRNLLNDIFHTFIMSCAFSLIYLFFSEPGAFSITYVQIVTLKAFALLIFSKLAFEMLLRNSERPHGWFREPEKMTDFRKNKWVDLESAWLQASTEERDKEFRSICAHEAGHAVMVYLCGIKGFYLKTKYPYKDFLRYNESVKYPILQDAETLRNKILIDYAGIAAEEIITGEYLVNKLSDNKCDIFIALNDIRDYVIMTHPEFSKTGLDDGINSVIVEVSKSIYAEAVEKLTLNRFFLEAVMNKLCLKERLSYEELAFLARKRPDNTTETEKEAEKI